MDSRFLESLVKVVDTGSFAQAARIQHLTAAAISQRIRALEIELGTALLFRNGHSTRPTEACLKLIPQARKIINEVHTLRNNMKHSRKMTPFRLGVIPSQWSPQLPKKIDLLRESTMAARVSLSINTSTALLEQLSKGEVDAVVIERPHLLINDHFKCFQLRREALVLLHQDESHKSISEILCDNNYIEYLPDQICINQAKKYVQNQGLNPEAICDTTSLATIKVLVNDGVGVSLVPKWPGLDGCLENMKMAEIYDPRYARDIVLVTTENADRQQLIERLISIFRCIDERDSGDFTI